MKTLNVDGIDRDIDELIRDKVKISMESWCDFYVIPVWPIAYIGNMYFVAVDEEAAPKDYAYTLTGFPTGNSWLTYKEPAKKHQATDRIEELYQGLCNTAPGQVRCLHSMFNAMAKYLDEVAYEKE